MCKKRGFPCGVIVFVLWLWGCGDDKRLAALRTLTWSYSRVFTGFVSGWLAEGAASPRGLGRTWYESGSGWDGRIGCLWEVVTQFLLHFGKRAVGLAVTPLVWYFFTSSSCLTQHSTRVAWMLGKRLSEFPSKPVHRFYHNSVVASII